MRNTIYREVTKYAKKSFILKETPLRAEGETISF